MRGIDNRPVVEALREKAAEVGEQAIEELGAYFEAQRYAQQDYGEQFFADPRQWEDDSTYWAQWDAEHPRPDVSHLERRAASLSRKARAIADCGRDLILSVAPAAFAQPDTPNDTPLGEAWEDPRRVSWARCRVRGCPWCGVVDAWKIRTAALSFAEEMERDGYELRVLHLTIPGDPGDTLRERSDAFKTHIRYLTNSWRVWKERVAFAQVYYEAPWNRWRSRRLADVAADGDGHHWHWHAHMLVWARPGNSWAATDEEGRELDGGLWSPVAEAWSRTTGTPLGTLRVQVAEPHAQKQGELTADIGCAVAYAAKYASKGTGADDADPQHIVRWIEESKGIQFMSCYGPQRLKSRWMELKTGKGTEKAAIVGIVDELESRSARFERRRDKGRASITDPHPDVELPQAAELRDESESLRGAAAAEMLCAFLQVTNKTPGATVAGPIGKKKARGKRAAAVHLLSKAMDIERRAKEARLDRDCWLLLQYFNGRMRLSVLEQFITGGSLKRWLEDRKPKEFSDMVERRSWSRDRALWRRRLSRRHGELKHKFVGAAMAS